MRFALKSVVMKAQSTSDALQVHPSLRTSAAAAGRSEDIGALMFLGGGEHRAEPLTGVKALMLAVLEDGIRCYFSQNRLVRTEADHWIQSRQRSLVFSFEVICETFGIEASAARRTLHVMREQGRRALPVVRTRPNVRHNTVSLVRKRRRGKAALPRA